MNILTIIILLAGFAALIYGARFLVDSSSSLAKKFNIPGIVIGLTIVAFGTSSPELLVSLIASANGNSELALGNVIGSNIFNILFILGLSAIVYPLKVKSGTTWIEIPLAVLSAVVVLVLANDIFLDHSETSHISRSDGIVLLLFFLVFLVYNITVMMKNSNNEELNVKDQATWKSVIFIIGGLLLLVVGARAIVYSSVRLAQVAGFSERVIGLTIVSIGTSLPEAATSLVAARRKNTDIAIGNIVGSNIFNVFLILGGSAAINPVPVQNLTNIDLAVNLFASLLLFIFIFTGSERKIGRLEGILFIILFLAYITFLLLLR